MRPVVGGGVERRDFPGELGGSTALPDRHRGAGAAEAVPAGRGVGEQFSVDFEVVTRAERVDPHGTVPRLEVLCKKDNGIRFN